MKTFILTCFTTPFHLAIKIDRYERGGRAVSLINMTEGDEEYGLEFARISTWLFQTPLLHDDEFFVKDWSENEAIVDRMIELELLEQIDHAPVPSGHVMVRAYKLTPKAAEYLHTPIELTSTVE
jgi:hypothetical protein